ncbi:hypothetical protein [uncultured Vagococcus sp.]|uniref:hypothetical protein n=1 Tax=uncultured Vagococcus sp. TaxID=189676 RepID=UPI0028D62762|nr:hypothetical protein [uncultured Vagococcus sp.]
MYYKILLNPKNNKSMLGISGFAILALPIASSQGQLKPFLIAYIFVVIFLFYHSKSTLQFYTDKYVLKTLLKEQSFNKDTHYIKLWGDSANHSDRLDRSYLLIINNKVLHTREKEIPMSMTSNQYANIQKKLIDLAEV